MLRIVFLTIEHKRNIMIYRLTLLFTIILVCSSCSTLNTVLKDKEAGKGTRVVYDTNFDQSWLLAKKAFRWAGSDAIEEYKEEGYMLTTKGANLITYGSVMGAWIERISDNKMAVTVISKRRISTNLATGMTEPRFHSLFKAGLKILEKGEELPLSAPKVDTY